MGIRDRFGGIEFELARGRLNHALEQIIGFGPARAAIGPGRHGVGEIGRGIHHDVRNVIEARQAEGEVDRRHQHGDAREISARVLPAFDAQREDLAVRLALPATRPILTARTPVAP